MSILSKLIPAKAAAQTVVPTTPVDTVKPPKPFEEGLVSTKDVIAPSALEVDTDFIKIGNKYYRSVFTVINRRFVEINWLSTLINFDASQTVAMYIYPSDGKEILDDLRRKIAEMEAEITTDIQRGRVVNPATQAKLEDALNLQADLVKGEERFFQMGLYITISSDTKEDLDKVTKNLESAMGALMVLTKKTSYDSENGFVTTLPLGQDRLNVTRNMDTTSLATTFPFVSSDLSDDKGIMFGINQHNGSLVIFDRFSMPNYNSVVFATAGAGKSYMIKLEALRSLMMGADIIVIDPENEYRDLCEATGGQYIAFGYQENSKINPFDLALEGDDGENALNSKILNLHKMLKIMIGDMTPIEESILDRAIMDAYKMKGVTPDPETQKKEPPLIEDLYKSLIGMESKDGQNLAARLEKYIRGSFAGIFNQKTTVNLKSNFVVFGIRNLEDALRPVAMHIILDYIWTVVKKELRRRILVVDEAWYLMQYPDSASFLRGIVKRGRKYYLGVTTITQDVDDFLETAYGKEIVTNSSIQILLKQHSAAIDQIGEVFYLSEGEKQLLLAADKGEGIFFAGQNHVAIKVIASEEEHKLITSNPEEVMKYKQQKLKLAQEIEEDRNRQKLTVMEETPGEKINNDKLIINNEKKEPFVQATPLGINNQDTITKLEVAQPASVPTAQPTPQPVVEKPVEPAPLLITNNQDTITKIQTISNDQKPITKQTVDNGAPINDKREENKTETQDQLKQRIAEMEAVEKVKVEEHKKQVEIDAEEAKKKKEEEEKKKAEMFGGSFGKLPSYQELFKSKLPPLPPLPKTNNQETITNNQTNPNDQKPITKLEESNPFKAVKTEVVSSSAKVGSGVIKPTFIKPQEEVKVPQPAQLKKITNNQETSIQTNSNNQPPITKPEEIKTEAKKGDNQNTPGMDYDKLFGNGIV